MPGTRVSSDFTDPVSGPGSTVPASKGGRGKDYIRNES